MKKLAFFSAFLLTPMLAFAQVQSVRTVFDLGAAITSIIDGVLVPVIFALAFVVFIWGVFKTFIQGGEDPEKREEGQKLMLYGLIGFFIMVSVWGLVNILVGSFRLNDVMPRPPATPGLR
jgi:Type IV secretion system pilin